MNGGSADTDTIHGEVLQVREQADEAGKLLDAGFGVSQGEGQDSGLEDVAMFVQPEKRRFDIEVTDVELLKARERMQSLHRRGYQEVCLIELSNSDHLADKVDYPHLLKVANDVKPLVVPDREGSMEASSSRDTPCTGEVGASEEGRAVVRNVVDNAVNDLLGKPRVAYFTDPGNPPRVRVEALAPGPRRVGRLFCICVATLVRGWGEPAKTNNFTKASSTNSTGGRASSTHLLLSSVVVGSVKG